MISAISDGLYQSIISMILKLPYKVYSSNSKCVACQPIIHHLCGSNITSLQAWAQIRTVKNMYSKYDLESRANSNLFSAYLASK